MVETSRYVQCSLPTLLSFTKDTCLELIMAIGNFALQSPVVRHTLLMSTSPGCTSHKGVPGVIHSTLLAAFQEQEVVD